MDRRDVRLPTNRSVRLKFTDRQRFETLYMRDISKGGLFVKTQRPAPPGTRVTIVLDLPGGTEVRLEGEVAHVVAPGPGVEPRRAGMGVALRSLTPALRAAIEIYLKGVEDDFIEGGEEIAFDLPAPLPPVGPVADILEPPEPWELELMAAAAAPPAPAPSPPPPPPTRPPPPAPAAPAPAPPAPAAPAPAAAAPPRPAPPAPARRAPAASRATPEETQAIETMLAQVEPRLGPRTPRRPPNAYEALGCKPADAVAQIALGHRHERAALDPGRWRGRLPEPLLERMERAARALDAAWDVLGHPERRAVLDLQLTVVPPPPSRTVAERLELIRNADRLHERFAAAQPDRVASARTLAEGAAADIAEGRLARARNALRLAIGYDPLSTRLWLLLDEADGGGGPLSGR